MRRYVRYPSVLLAIPGSQPESARPTSKRNPAAGFQNNGFQGKERFGSVGSQPGCNPWCLNETIIAHFFEYIIEKVFTFGIQGTRAGISMIRIPKIIMCYILYKSLLNFAGEADANH
jgi:hypothetical protein